jgi:hypothetical protein
MKDSKLIQGIEYFCFIRAKSIKTKVLVLIDSNSVPLIFKRLEDRFPIHTYKVIIKGESCCILDHWTSRDEDLSKEYKHLLDTYVPLANPEVYECRSTAQGTECMKGDNHIKGFILKCNRSISLVPVYL